MTELFIITGAAGAGKTLCLQAFEEAAFYVTDNIPVGVVNCYFDNIKKDPEKYKKVALSVSLSNAAQTYALAIKYNEFKVKFVGITCEEDVLFQRFRLTKKMHPRQPLGISLEDCVKDDIKMVRELRDSFDIFIDTTKLNKNEFRSLVYDTCIGSQDKFTVSFCSFGYKISIPQDIETVFDVRLLPNPYWIPELRDKTGLDKEIKDYILNAPETKEYLKNVINYLEYYLKELRKNNRNHATIGIACSGGQHRSIVIAEYLAHYFSDKYNVTISHKDLPK